MTHTLNGTSNSLNDDIIKKIHKLKVTGDQFSFVVKPKKTPKVLQNKFQKKEITVS